MSTSGKAVVQPVAAGPSNTDAAPRDPHDWSAYTPLRLDVADAMPMEEAQLVWANLYAAANLTNATEEIKKGFRGLVYAEMFVQGTSRAGGYVGKMQASNGTVLPVSIIPSTVPQGQLRRFLRADLEESYNALKTMRLDRVAAKRVAKATELGIPANYAFATADWLTGCPEFRAPEAEAHKVYMGTSIRRANAARGGTLESVERSYVEPRVPSQAPVGEAITF